MSEPDVVDLILATHRLARSSSTPARCTIVGVGGPVAVGKSTFARELAESLGGRRHSVVESPVAEPSVAEPSVAVVSCDGFLWPNAELQRRGLFERKGEPSTFDLERLAAFLGDVHDGVDGLPVPLYSHEDYDVAEDPVPFRAVDVLVVEGIVVLQKPIRRLLDLGIYLDADPDLTREWFVARLASIVEALPETSTNVLTFFRSLAPDELRAAAVATWEAFNVPNNERHIQPTRDGADAVVTKGTGHRVTSVEIR